MHKAIVCIGSNVVKAPEFIEKAVIRIIESGARVDMRSDIYTVNLPYYNCVAEISTELELQSLIAQTKEIEAGMGRTHAMKAKSEVPIDIDVVVFDNITLRPADYSAEYFKLGYHNMKIYFERVGNQVF